MSTGKSSSVYFSSNTSALLKDIQKKNKRSASDAISLAVEDLALQYAIGISISSGAYVCLAMGRFDMLQHVVLEDGSVMIQMKSEATNDSEISSRKNYFDKYISNPSGVMFDE